MLDEMASTNQSQNETFEEVFQRRLNRRSLLKGSLASVPLVVFGPLLLKQPSLVAAEGDSTLTFQPIQLSTEDAVIVPPGYATQVVIRWGEPLHPHVPPLDILDQSEELQAQQFGYNCDFVGYFPLHQRPFRRSSRGILAVNNEFPGETEIEITGPASGHDWLQVSYDPTGTKVRGTFDNCSGGKTSWGTLLTCEENFQNRFANRDALADDDPRKAIHTRYGLPAGATMQRWELFHPRFDLAQEPNEPFRFG
jgi:secreted PhoX family phosphatase